MPEFVYHLSSIPLFIFFCSIFTLASIVVISLAYRYLPLHFRYQENTAIVSCGAFLGVTYAILIGFTILYEMTEFGKADAAEALEGKTLYTIYHVAKNLPAHAGSTIDQLVVAYAKHVLEHEWPALKNNQLISMHGEVLINQITQQITKLQTKSVSSAVLDGLASATNTLFELHNARVAKVHSTLNGHIWFVMLLATCLTVGINCVLGMEYRLHVICLTVISAMIAAILYLLVGLDRPYQGDFAVKPQTIRATLEYIT